MRLINWNPAFEAKWAMVINDDFTHIVTGDLWTIVATDSGTATVGDAGGGILTLAPSDGTVADNDQIYVRTTNEIFDVNVGEPIYAEFEIQYAEAATDDANVMFGFMNAVAAEALVDNGGGPKADYSGAVIFKVDGGTTWVCESSVGTSQTTTPSTTTAGGAAFHTFGIGIQPLSTGSTAEVTFSIDGQPFRDSSDNVIKHSLTITSLTQMHLFVGAKNGDTNNEAILVDAIRAGYCKPNRNGG